MEIVLIRHGEPEWVRDGLNVVDPPLTERGLRQAERVADALDGEEFDEIVDLAAAPAAPDGGAARSARRGADEVIEPFLEEIREPNWHGTPAELAQKAYEEERSRAAAERWEGIVGGEASRDFVERVRAGATDVPGRIAACIAAKQTLPRVAHRSARPAHRRVRPRRHQRRAAVPSAGPRSGAVGVGPLRHRPRVDHAAACRCKLGDGHTFSLTKLCDVEHLAVDDRTGMSRG